MESVASQEARLTNEAETLIEELGLLQILRRHGRAEIVGSVALGLIVKLDIDLHLLVEADDLLCVCDDIYHRLLAHRRVQHIRISDYRDRGGLKVGIDALPAPSGRWSIDMWVTNRPEATGFALVDTLRDKLTPDTREAILSIKRHYHESGHLRDGLSTTIYKAVVEHGVSTPQEFDRFLQAGDE